VHRVILCITPTSNKPHQLSPLNATPLQPYAIDTIHPHFPVSAPQQGIRLHSYYSTHTSPYIHTPLLTTSTLPTPLTCTSHRPDPLSRLYHHLVSKIIIAIVDPPYLGRRPEHHFFGLLRLYCALPPAWLTVPTYYGQRPRSPKLHHCIGRRL